MGLFDKIFAGAKKGYSATSYFKTLTAYTPVFTTWRGGIYESELCRAAIDATARHISKLKFEAHGEARPRLQTKLKKAPNEWQTWSQFLYRTATILEANNTCFIVPVIDGYGDTTGIYTIMPTYYELIEYGGEPFLRFHFATGDVSAIELRRVGILTRYQYEDDYFGSSNHALIPTLELIHLQRQGVGEAVKNSASYRFMAKVSNFTSDDDLAEERKRFAKTNLEGSDGGVLLFPNTYNEIKQIDSKPYNVNPEEAQAIRTSVFDYFGTNEKIIQSSANDDEMDAFFDAKIEPFSIQLSGVLTRMLYTLTEQGYGNEIFITANRLMYMSVSHKVQMVKELGDRGALLIDEARELFNLAPLPDGTGQKAMARGEYYDVITGNGKNQTNTEETNDEQ